jgi:hypothetical protein
MKKYKNAYSGIKHGKECKESRRKTHEKTKGKQEHMKEHNKRSGIKHTEEHNKSRKTTHEGTHTTRYKEHNIRRHPTKK